MEITAVLGARVLLYLDPLIKEKGGIVLVEQLQETSTWGTVTHAGPKCKYLKVGDHVMTTPTAGTRFRKGDESVLIVFEDEVLAKDE